MPYKSQAQERFFNSSTGKAKVGQKVVNEFNAASKGMKLPAKSKSVGGRSKGAPKGSPKAPDTFSRPGKASWGSYSS